jgi:signal transduction histidine kinase
MRAVLPWVLVAITLVLGVAGAALGAVTGGEGNEPWLITLAAGALLASATVGFVLTSRRPENPIGWILAANAAMLAALFLVEAYGSWGLAREPDAAGTAWAALISNSDWPLLFAGPLAAALFFPDGRLPSPRWRRVAVAIAVVYALVIVSSVFSPEPFDAPFEEVQNPAPTTEVVTWLMAPLLLALVGSFVAAYLAVRVRYRRGDAVQRAQVLWFTYAAALLPLSLVGCIALGRLVGDPGAPIIMAIFGLQIAVPAAIGIAVLRYRLYEIDRIVNRTLVYVTLTVLLAAAWGVSVVLLGVASGRGSPWATAGATLVAAVAFRPARAWIQSLVDRRFDRRRYDAVRQVEAFLRDLREDRAAPEGIRDVLARALGDPGLEVAFWLPETGVHADASGRTVEPRAGPGRVATPVGRGGAPLGVVLHDTSLAERPQLLDPVLVAAGLAIEIARLRVELRRQLAEVEASRARIVAAGYEERRQLERDLHDGAQQRLVTVGLSLRHLQHHLPPSANGLGAGLDDAVAEVGAAIDELRELARGVRPALLDEGIGPALRQLADRCPVPVELDSTEDRLEPDVEATAYFVVSEALTNAVKHGRATRVLVRAEHAAGRLTISVADDGCGGAEAAPGSGLSGLSDRVAAHGGVLRVTSPPGAGTTVAAELPCG